MPNNTFKNDGVWLFDADFARCDYEIEEWKEIQSTQYATETSIEVRHHRDSESSITQIRRHCLELNSKDMRAKQTREIESQSGSEGVTFHSAVIHFQMEYELEDINVFGKALNLQQSICNSGCHEFVLVRKFSSRGEFHPRGTMFRQKSAALLTPVSRSSNNPVFDFSNALASPGETPCTPSGGVSPFMLCEDNEAVMSFRVNRIHRVKRNWAGIMSIRWDSFDIAPLASGRRSFFPNSYQKAITVPWTNLCDVKCVERASGEASTVLAVAFLPVLEKERDLPAQEVTLRHIAQGYEGRTWKVVLVEFESEANANQAKEHILGVLRAVNPPAYQAYQRSNDGSRGPSESAEAVLMEMADGLLPATSRPPKMSTMKKLRRLRRALNSRRD
ncbi:unnamed protein product [Heligmosomoides polygyrus]|uniref:SAWADEE domain-containing protein n=1 Tax=Heligmosomoides polygyrus TaxID=6339 RepID=A0A3P7Z620_HELPZ|nr:unnamed protein product [Heligmosomoides polygyrus]